MSSGGSVAAGSGGGATGDGARAGDSDPSQRTRTAAPDSDASAATPSSIAVDPDSRRSSISHLPTGDLRAYLRIRELQHKELVEALERLQARMNEDREAQRVEREREANLRAARCCTIV